VASGGVENSDSKTGWADPCQREEDWLGGPRQSTLLWQGSTLSTDNYLEGAAGIERTRLQTGGPVVQRLGEARSGGNVTDTEATFSNKAARTHTPESGPTAAAPRGRGEQRNARDAQPHEAFQEGQKHRPRLEAD